MFDKIVKLFYESCPVIITDDERIESVLKASEVFTLTNTEGEIIGAAAVKGQSIAMLCVRPDYRGKGYGRTLFTKCEEYVKSQGYSSIKMFGVDDYITPGAPLYEGNWELFEHLGYTHTWGEDECVDMWVDLTDYHCSEYKLGDCVNGITYRFATPSDRTAVLECVGDALESFVPYYSGEELYLPDNEEHILIAVDGDKVCGCLLVECYNKDRGSVGCTSTRHSHRGRGVATNMVKVATRYLADEGFKASWLGFTYTGIIPMYGKSGYKVFMKYFMGEKSL